MSTSETTAGQKISETLKRFVLGIVILMVLFAGLRGFICDMGAAAVALVAMSLVVNIYFADSKSNSDD